MARRAMDAVSDLDADTTPRCPRCQQPEGECDCPHDEDGPIVCAHGVWEGAWCPSCDLNALTAPPAYLQWFGRLLDRVSGVKDAATLKTEIAAYEARRGFGRTPTTAAGGCVECGLTDGHLALCPFAR